MKSCELCGRRYGRSEALVYRKDGFDVVRCPECGLVCRYDLPTRQDLDEIYRREYFVDDLASENRSGYFDYLADERLHRANARRRLRQLERLSEARRVLDVGCAAGFFVDEAVRRGWNAFGVDVSAPMVDWGRENLGADLSVGTLHDVAANGPFDVVTMWDYLEHSIGASADLEAANRLLEPGGLIAISTGDIASLAARVSRSSWHLLTPRHHNYFFSVTTLERMLRRAGFESLRTRHPGAAYSLAHVVYKLETLLPGESLRRGARMIGDSRLANAPLRLNLGDIVTVVARKVRSPADLPSGRFAGVADGALDRDGS